jgi:hypothetical protein
MWNSIKIYNIACLKIVFSVYYVLILCFNAAAIVPTLDDVQFLAGGSLNDMNMDMSDPNGKLTDELINL